MDNGKDIADFAVEFATLKGASYAEARFVDCTEEGYTTKNGRVIGAGEKRSKGIGVRVLAEGGMGFCSTAKLDKKNVEEQIKRAIKMARASNRREPIVFSEEEVVQTRWQTEVEQEFADVSDEEKKEFVIGLDKSLMSQDFGQYLVNRTLMLNMNKNRKYIVTSDGSRVKSEKSLISFYTFNTAKGSMGTEQRFFGMAGSSGWEWLEKKKVREEVVKDNRTLVKAALNAKPMRLGETDAVVCGEVAGIMAHENTGHPSEGDRILGREGAQAGESFYIDLLEDEELGEIKIGSKAVTIIDDPTMPDSAGYYLYDDECVKARPRYLIKDGMLNELLLNREFATKFDLTSNAAARATDYNREPIIRMANTYFAPGDYEVEELMEDIKEGVYIKSFTEWNIDDRRFQSKYVGLETYLIKNGEVTDRMIRRPVLELTTFGLLGSVDAVSKDIDITYATCGKGDPPQGVPVGHGGPHMRIRNIRLGGQQ